MTQNESHITTPEFSIKDGFEQTPIRLSFNGIHNSKDFQRPYRSNFFEIFFFAKGGGTHAIDFIEYTIADNSVHLVRPGQVYALKREAGLHSTVINFSPEILSQILSSYELLQHIQDSCSQHTTEDFMKINLLIQLLEEELNKKTFLFDTAAIYLNLLLTKSLVKGNENHVIESKEYKIFSAFKQLAELHLKTGKPPLWYATQLSITEKKLNTACKIISGNTISNYIKERLLLETKRLLCLTNDNIKEIGYQLGFNDPAYFNRFFSKNEGQTAGDFRNQYK